MTHRDSFCINRSTSKHSCSVIQSIASQREIFVYKVETDIVIGAVETMTAMKKVMFNNAQQQTFSFQFSTNQLTYTAYATFCHKALSRVLNKNKQRCTYTAESSLKLSY